MATNKPFFVPQKEVDLFDALNEELIDEIIGQTVDIYKISIEDTQENMGHIICACLFVCS